MTSLWEAKSKLVIETNSGTRVINKKGIIPGYGEVWLGEQEFSNLFSLSDMVKRVHMVTYKSDKVMTSKSIRKMEGISGFPYIRGAYISKKKSSRLRNIYKIQQASN